MEVEQMTLTELIEKVNKIKEIVKNNYNPVYCGYTEMRSMGNSTDVFQDGSDHGKSVILYEIGCILDMDLEEPEEQEYDF